MEQLSLKFKSDIFIVRKRENQIKFLPKHPLFSIPLRLDIVQSTFKHPLWCTGGWQDLYLSIYIIRYLHTSFKGMLQIYLSNGDVLNDINSYENKINIKISSLIEYEDLLDAVEIDHVTIGENVKIYIEPTHSFCPHRVYVDAIAHFICVNGFNEDDYAKLSKCLKNLLKDNYRVGIV